jgi:hypothetical protein
MPEDPIEQLTVEEVIGVPPPSLNLVIVHHGSSITRVFFRCP